MHFFHKECNLCSEADKVSNTCETVEPRVFTGLLKLGGSFIPQMLVEFKKNGKKKKIKAKKQTRASFS